MATFEIEAGGHTYEVDAPSAEAAMAVLSGQPPKADAPPSDRIEPKMGLLVSQNDKGEIGPGSIPRAVMELMKNGYQPVASQPVSSEEAPPGVDTPAIKNAFEAASLGMPAESFPQASREAIFRALGAHEAFGPAPSSGLEAIAHGAAPPRPAPPGPSTPAPALREDRIAAGNRQDVTLPEFVANDSALQKSIAGGVSGTPYIGDPIRESMGSMAEQMGTRADTLSQRMGSVGADPEVAGARAKAGLLDWIGNRSKADVQAGYDVLDKLVDPDQKVNPQNLRNLAAEFKARDIESGTADGQKAIDLINGALQKRDGLTFAGIKHLRTTIGDRLNGDIVDPGLSQKNLSAIFAAASEDLKFAAGRASKGRKADAVAAFDAANTKARETFAMRADLGDVVGAKGDASSSEVFNRVLALASSGAREDTQKLLLAKQSMGDAGWNDIRAGAIARMGADRDGNFSPLRFLTDYGDKKFSENGRNILFGPELRPHLDDLRLLAQAWEGAAKHGNPSGSGRAVAVMAALTALFASPVHLITEAATGNVIARVLSRPATARTVKQYAQAYTQAAQEASPATALLLQQSARALAGTLAQAGGGDEREILPKLALTQKHTPSVESVAQAARLPRGAEFIDPNGVRRRNNLRPQAGSP